ncbi:MAG: 2-oxoglutarate ferredoxin oxidoreductase subunit alpha [Chloroflexi bacterium]|nr:2-oxoglutarate ferredoxin oxidoreductase subunit alpha [Chloroflexota bacterium]
MTASAPEKEAKVREGRVFFQQGNFAIVEGAIAAGCRFMAGYPITPATEIAEMMSRRLPEVGGYYVQFEDELGSIHAVCGASLAGAKAMTATSGPGFSLFHDGYSYAIKNEIPLVVVDSQRVGPANGISAHIGCGEFYSARYVTHGGNYETIVLAPNSVQEAFYLTIDAFNLAEIFRTPVTLLTDKVISDMRETLVIPPIENIRCVNRISPPRDQAFINFPLGTSQINYPMQVVGEHCGGLGVCVAPYTHTPMGYAKEDFETQEAMSYRLINKIRDHRDLILRYEKIVDGDEDLILVSYGAVSRSAKTAMAQARQQGMKIGFIRLISLWPFPEELFTWDTRYLVCEMVYEGQLVREVERAAPDRRKVHFLGKSVELFRPSEIVARIKEVFGQ